MKLAHAAGISPQTASTHLAKLVEGNLISVESQGRHRYYRLASPHVAEMLELMSLIAPPVQVRSLNQSIRGKEIQAARTCYDHLAGKLGVEITEALLRRGLLLTSGDNYSITEAGKEWFAALGIDLPKLAQKRRHFARQCLDWSERRHHLAGALGAALATCLFERGWIVRTAHGRGITLTEKGKAELSKELGIDFGV